MGGLLAGGVSCSKKSSDKPALLCYVGGTMKPVMKELAKRYEEKTGQRIDIDPGGSGVLMIKIQQTQIGDLYVCHDPFVGQLMKEGHGVKAWTVASLTPMIAVRKDETSIRSFADLTRPGVKVDVKVVQCRDVLALGLLGHGLRRRVYRHEYYIADFQAVESGEIVDERISGWVKR